MNEKQAQWKELWREAHKAQQEGANTLYDEYMESLYSVRREAALERIIAAQQRTIEQQANIIATMISNQDETLMELKGLNEYADMIDDRRIAQRLGADYSL